MIKATIQRSPYVTEMTFPCSETQLSKWLDELRMLSLHLVCGFIRRGSDYDDRIEFRCERKCSDKRYDLGNRKYEYQRH